jgi:hypothetical protein
MSLVTTGTPTWQPFGDINQYAPNWALKKDWGAPGFFDPKVIGEKADAYWNNTRYNPATPIPITRENLMRFQGKMPFRMLDPNTLTYPHQSLLEYLFYLKKCSQLEPHTCLPDFVAFALKEVNRQKEYNQSMQKRNNDISAVCIAVIAIIAVATTVASLGTAGPAVFTAASLLTIVAVGAAGAAFSYGLTQIPGIGSYIAAWLSDPSTIFLPTVNTSNGLISRCSLMDQVIQQSSKESKDDYEQILGKSAISEYMSPIEEVISYQQYNYLKLEQQNIYKNYLPSILSNPDPNSMFIDRGFELFLAAKGIVGGALITHYQNTVDANVNSDEYRDFVAYNQYISNSIRIYERNLFYPVAFRPTLVSRPAILQLTNVRFGLARKSNGDFIFGPTGRPNYDTDIYATVSIIDPGEGFYDLDSNGNSMSYTRQYDDITYTTSGNSTITSTYIQLIGRYLYDSADETKTAVKGLATFNHYFNKVVIGTSATIRFRSTAGAELNGQTITIYPPVYSPVDVAGEKAHIDRVRNARANAPSGGIGSNTTTYAGSQNRTQTGRVYAPAHRSGWTHTPSAKPPTPFIPPARRPGPLKRPAGPSGGDFRPDPDPDLDPDTGPGPGPGPDPKKGKIKLTRWGQGKPPPIPPHVRPKPRPPVRPPPIKIPPQPFELQRQGAFRGTRPADGGAKLKRGAAFRLPRPTPRPIPIKVDGWGKVLGVIGIAVTVAFAVIAIQETLKRPAPATDCSGLSSGNH